MAIYDIKPGDGVLPTLNTMTGYKATSDGFGEVDKVIGSIKKTQDTSLGTIQKNMDNLNSITDKMTGMRIDNNVQQSQLDSVKKDTGIDNVFSTVNLESLKNPYGTKIVESAYNNFVRDPRIESIQAEQRYSDMYQKIVGNLEDPILRDMAKKDYEDYRAGNITGDKLDASLYQYRDIAEEIGKEFKNVATKVDTYIQKLPGGEADMYGTKEYKDKVTLNMALQNKMQDPGFINNLVARGFYDKTKGALTEDGTTYFDNMIGIQSAVKDKGRVHYYPQWKATGGSNNGGSKSGSKSGGRRGSSRASRGTEFDRQIEREAPYLKKYGIDVNNYANLYKEGGTQIPVEVKRDNAINAAFNDPSPAQSKIDMISAGTGLSRKQVIETQRKSGNVWPFDALMKGDFKVRWDKLKLQKKKDFIQGVYEEYVKAGGTPTPKPKITKENSSSYN